MRRPHTRSCDEEGRRIGGEAPAEWRADGRRAERRGISSGTHDAELGRVVLAHSFSFACEPLRRTVAFSPRKLTACDRQAISQPAGFLTSAILSSSLAREIGGFRTHEPTDGLCFSSRELSIKKNKTKRKNGLLSKRQGDGSDWQSSFRYRGKPAWRRSSSERYPARFCTVKLAWKVPARSVSPREDWGKKVNRKRDARKLA